MKEKKGKTKTILHVQRLTNNERPLGDLSPWDPRTPAEQFPD